MKPQRLELTFFLGSSGDHVAWGGYDKWTGDPAVECACGWSTNVQDWADVRTVGHDHLLTLVPAGLRGPLGLVT